MSEEIKLLIIDDDEELCETLSDIFREWGYETETANTGKEALEKLKERQFNLALIDVKLPDVRGTELLRTLKEMQPEIEAIMISGRADLNSAIEALRHGAFNYIKKPIDMDEVETTIKNALARQLLARDRELQLATDGLTGLYNRRRFQKLLTQEIARARRYHHPLSLLMIDIDGFKEYNDAYGHLAGDDALIMVAQTLLEVSRRTDILARYGGEEFAIIMPETEKGTAAIASERLREAIERAKPPHEGRLTVSIGVASYPSDAKDGRQLISRADQALYQAKRAGRNQIRVWQETDSKSTEQEKD